MEFKEGDWIPEVEMKCDGVSLSQLTRGLERLPSGTVAEKIFSGTLRTYWFNGALEKGTSARIRIAYPDDGMESTTVTFKKPSPHESHGRKLHVKTKLENNRPVASFEEALDVLHAGARSLALIRPKRNLVNDLTVTKRRTSFSVLIPGEEFFQTDADAFISFNPDPSQYEDEQRFLNKLCLTELEAVDEASAIVKEKRLLGYAGLMKFKVIPAFAPLNTSRYLRAKGEM